MSTRLKTAVAASIALSVMVNTALLVGGLYAAYHWPWLHPAGATTAVIFIGIGLSLAFAEAAWRFGNRKEPYRGELL